MVRTGDVRGRVLPARHRRSRSQCCRPNCGGSTIRSCAAASPGCSGPRPWSEAGAGVGAPAEPTEEQSRARRDRGHDPRRRNAGAAAARHDREQQDRGLPARRQAGRARPAGAGAGAEINLTPRLRRALRALQPARCPGASCRCTAGLTPASACTTGSPAQLGLADLVLGTRSRCSPRCRAGPHRRRRRHDPAYKQAGRRALLGARPRRVHPRRTDRALVILGSPRRRWRAWQRAEQGAHLEMAQRIGGGRSRPGVRLIDMNRQARDRGRATRRAVARRWPRSHRPSA